MRTDIHIGIFDLLVFLGVFQGLLLAWFFIKNGRKGKKPYLLQGLLILSLSLAIFEELLNNTGYIVKCLPLSNYAEALNFTFGPLFYLYIRSSINTNEKRKDWLHFILATSGFYIWVSILCSRTILNTIHTSTASIPTGLIWI